MSVLGVVLSAGLGTRLDPFTRVLPKPLMTVASRPVLGHVLAAVSATGVSQVLVNVHHHAEKVAAFLDALPKQPPIHHRYEPRLRGPAGALLTFADQVGAADTILVGSGDVLFDGDLSSLVDAHNRTGAALTFAARRTAGARRYGVLEVGRDGMLLSCREKPDVPDDLECWVSAGIYCLSSSVLPMITEICARQQTCDYARELAPALLAAGLRVGTHHLSGYWCDIGTPKALYQANLDVVCGRAGRKLMAGVDTADATEQWPMGVPVYVDSTARVGRGVSYLGPTVVGASAQVGDGCSLADTVMLTGAVMLAGTAAVGALIGNSMCRDEVGR